MSSPSLLLVFLYFTCLHYKQKINLAGTRENKVERKKRRHEKWSVLSRSFVVCLIFLARTVTSQSLSHARFACLHSATIIKLITWRPFFNHNGQGQTVLCSSHNPKASHFLRGPGSNSLCQKRKRGELIITSVIFHNVERVFGLQLKSENVSATPSAGRRSHHCMIFCFLDPNGRNHF